MKYGVRSPGRLRDSGGAAAILTAEFQPTGVGKQQLSESVASHLREQIISGRLKKGEFLRIDAIAKALNVSTTPVREGLLLLQSESFVRLMPRRGFVVNSFSRGDLVDLFWAQATLAAELAARASAKMSKSDFATLQELHRQHEHAVHMKDTDRAARSGHQFHRAINLAAESPRLALLLGGLTKQLPNRFYASIEGQLQGAVEYHPIIMNAMRMKDTDAVRSLMFRHVISGAEHLVEMLERQGTWGAAKPAPPVAQAGKAQRGKSAAVKSTVAKPAVAKAAVAKAAVAKAAPPRRKAAPARRTRGSAR